MQLLARFSAVFRQRELERDVHRQTRVDIDGRQGSCLRCQGVEVAQGLQMVLVVARVRRVVREKGNEQRSHRLFCSARGNERQGAA